MARHPSVAPGRTRRRFDQTFAPPGAQAALRARRAWPGATCRWDCGSAGSYPAALRSDIRTARCRPRCALAGHGPALPVGGIAVSPGHTRRLFDQTFAPPGAQAALRARRAWPGATWGRDCGIAGSYPAALRSDVRTARCTGRAARSPGLARRYLRVGLR